MLLELGLFLIFLWGTSVFIIRPVLRNLDEREAAIQADRAAAEAANEEARHLEERHQAQAARIRIEAEERFRKQRQRIARETADALSAERRAADEKVMAARRDAQVQIEGQLTEIQAQAPEIARMVSERLGDSQR
jgi:F0F1-type ATP synthase membrane subunit b/b'